MTPEISAMIEKKFSKKRSKLFVLSIISLIILCGSFGTYYYFFYSKSASTLIRQAVKVKQGDITSAITGSGTITPSNRYELASKANATIRQIYFKEGDTVKSGDLLVELDDTDVRMNIDKANNSILQTQLTNETTHNSINNLNIRAPFSGIVSNIQFKEGDSVNKGANVLNIVDQSRLKASFPFSTAVAAASRIGQAATLNILDSMQAVSGKITYISPSTHSTTSGSQAVDIEITVNNPGALKEGMKVSAQIDGGNGPSISSDYGTLTSMNSLSLKSDQSGTAVKVYVRENQWVNKGDIMIKIENSDLAITSQTGNIKIQDLQNQLSTYKRQMDYYRITSPIDGTIVKQEIKTGDTAKLGDVLTIVSNSSVMEFTIPIDELDIEKISVGQTADVTVDAIPSTSRNPLEGTVTRVPLEGTTTSGITSYLITITLDQSEGLRNGMNANADIFTTKKTNVLYLPIQAVTKRQGNTYVTVKDTSGKSSQPSQNNNQGNSNSQSGSSTQSQGGSNSGSLTASQYAQYYANTKRVPVEVGVNNDMYIEIVSGLNLGDEVILPPVSTASNNTTKIQNQNQGGMLGGMPGMGGMGGMGGNNRNTSRTQGGNNNQRRD